MYIQNEIEKKSEKTCSLVSRNVKHNRRLKNVIYPRSANEYLRDNHIKMTHGNKKLGEKMSSCNLWGKK